MCKETAVELKRGKRVAEQIVRHVRRMGAGKATIPVAIGDESWTDLLEQEKKS